MVELTYKDTTIQVEHDADVHLYKSILDELNLTVVFAPVPPTEVYNREIMVDNQALGNNSLDIGKYATFKKTIGPDQQFELVNVYPFQFEIIALPGTGGLNLAALFVCDGKTVVLHNTNLDLVSYDPTKNLSIGCKIQEITANEIRINAFINQLVSA